MKNIYVQVRVSVPEDADAFEIVQDCDYEFSYEGEKLNTEIVEVFNDAQDRIFWFLVLIHSQLNFMYRICMLSEGVFKTLESFNSYDEADKKFDEYCDLYENAWVEIVSDADLIEAEDDW